MPKMIFIISTLFIFGAWQQCNPTDAKQYVYIVDIPHQVCTKKEVVSVDPKIKLASVPDKEHNLPYTELPLTYCDGMIGVHRDDWKDVKQKLENLIQDAKKQCTEFIQKVINGN